ncbi:hypothetical protein BOTCAL_0110g00120 [Botryotinia calthae]|uniref:Heterokaryon incompatibility domain-containing protein n=1 Tax=Botryotinia calthae TaxID=38488 RepID=A0A4Y8D7R6_9HELO|nr:hypothetical protein BOTCAL_0110g00120 [Botryotinia calthae]
MDRTTSSYVPSDDWEEGFVSEEQIHEAVLAAGKKAKITSLCEKCNQIVGWFFLEQEVFRRIIEIERSTHEIIHNFKIDELKPFCKLCNFLHSIWTEDEKNKNEEHFSLVRSTAGHMFGFEPFYRNERIFFLQSDGYDSEPRSHVTNVVFGFSNADAYKNGVAIRNLSLQADLILVREWIRLCDDNHVGSNFNCLPTDGVSLQGFTVIDCEDGRNILVPGTASMKYVTLSYVWGAEASEGPDQFGKLPSTLPNLITDAIKVVIALGYRYLWIDRYCIPQNDSSGIKSLLIKNMDKIYSQSILTIIATTAKCPSEGLPGITKPRIAVQKFLQMNSVRLVQWVSNIRHEIDNSVWNTRGWTYQEASLSRRRLVFTETQCYFQCDVGNSWGGEGGCRMESIDYVLTVERSYPGRSCIPTMFHSRPKDHTESDLSFFGRVVSYYTKRQLSKDSDVLPAFLGILSMFISECSNFHGHIYGVPIFEPEFAPRDTINALILGITWYCYKCLWSLEDIPAAVIPVRRRALPSWTWCDWIHASPSPYLIGWKDNTLSVRVRWRDMAPHAALSLEFEDGTILPWLPGHNSADLAKKAMMMGVVRSLHIVGWLTHLSIPHSCDHDEYFAPCGPYSIKSYEVAWLQRLARERAMNVTENKKYVFKAWVLVMVEPSGYFYDEGGEVHMMLLGETPKPSTFERFEVCMMNVKLKREGEGNSNSVEDVAKRLGWEMKAFELV